jgi:hypothetical protein
MIIVNSGDELLRIDIDGITKPKLTEERKRAVNIQLLRFLANRPREDNDLNRLVYMTIDFMPFINLQDFISTALWYYTENDLAYDNGDYLAVYKAFVEQQECLEKWHSLYNRNIDNYTLNTQFDRLDRKLQNNIMYDEYEYYELEINFTPLLILTIALIFLIIFVNKG